MIEEAKHWPTLPNKGGEHFRLASVTLVSEVLPGHRCCVALTSLKPRARSGEYLGSAITERPIDG